MRHSGHVLKISIYDYYLFSLFSAGRGERPRGEFNQSVKRRVLQEFSTTNYVSQNIVVIALTAREQ